MSRLDFYDFIDQCREDGLDPDDALREWDLAQAERHERFMEDYYNDDAVCAGWSQQDAIDARWRER